MSQAPRIPTHRRATAGLPDPNFTQPVGTPTAPAVVPDTANNPAFQALNILAQAGNLANTMGVIQRRNEAEQRRKQAEADEALDEQQTLERNDGKLAARQMTPQVLNDLKTGVITVDLDKPATEQANAYLDTLVEDGRSGPWQEGFRAASMRIVEGFHATQLGGMQRDDANTIASAADGLVDTTTQDEWDAQVKLLQGLRIKLDDPEIQQKLANILGDHAVNNRMQANTPALRAAAQEQLNLFLENAPAGSLKIRQVLDKFREAENREYAERLDRFNSAVTRLQLAMEEGGGQTVEDFFTNVKGLAEAGEIEDKDLGRTLSVMRGRLRHFIQQEEVRQIQEARDTAIESDVTSDAAREQLTGQGVYDIDPTFVNPITGEVKNALPGGTREARVHQAAEMTYNRFVQTLEDLPVHEQLSRRLEVSRSNGLVDPVVGGHLGRLEKFFALPEDLLTPETATQAAEGQLSMAQIAEFVAAPALQHGALKDYLSPDALEKVSMAVQMARDQNMPFAEALVNASQMGHAIATVKSLGADGANEDIRKFFTNMGVKATAENLQQFHNDLLIKHATFNFATREEALEKTAETFFLNKINVGGRLVDLGGSAGRITQAQANGAGEVIVNHLISKNPDLLIFNNIEDLHVTRNTTTGLWSVRVHGRSKPEGAQNYTLSDMISIANARRDMLEVEDNREGHRQFNRDQATRRRLHVHKKAERGQFSLSGVSRAKPLTDEERQAAEAEALHLYPDRDVPDPKWTAPHFAGTSAAAQEIGNYMMSNFGGQDLKSLPASSAFPDYRQALIAEELAKGPRPGDGADHPFFLFAMAQEVGESFVARSEATERFISGVFNRVFGSDE